VKKEEKLEWVLQGLKKLGGGRKKGKLRWIPRGLKIFFINPTILVSGIYFRFRGVAS
jgi:ASC-1-like (ASCH) protein